MWVTSFRIVELNLRLKLVKKTIIGENFKWKNVHEEYQQYRSATLVQENKGKELAWFWMKWDVEHTKIRNVFVTSFSNGVWTFSLFVTSAHRPNSKRNILLWQRIVATKVDCGSQKSKIHLYDTNITRCKGTSQFRLDGPILQVLYKDEYVINSCQAYYLKEALISLNRLMLSKISSLCCERQQLSWQHTLTEHWIFSDFQASISTRTHFELFLGFVCFINSNSLNSKFHLNNKRTNFLNPLRR